MATGTAAAEAAETSPSSDGSEKSSQPRGRGFGRPFQPGKSGNPLGRGTRVAALAKVTSMNYREATGAMLSLVGSQFAAIQEAASKREITESERNWVLNLINKLTRLEVVRGRLIADVLAIEHLPPEARIKALSLFVVEEQRPRQLEPVKEEPKP